MKGNLPTALSAAVPLWIMKFQGMPWTEVQANLSEKSKILPDLLGEKGDILLYGGGQPGEAAFLFNYLAEALALLSFLPGGVKLFGEHWESQHPGNAPGNAQDAPGLTKEPEDEPTHG